MTGRFGPFSARWPVPGWARLLVGLVAVAALGAAATSMVAAADGTDEATVRRDVPVTATDLRAERANNTPQLAVDPTEPRFVVMASRVDGPSYGCRLHVSGDGGRSWRPAPVDVELPEGADSCYAPQVDFDADGRLYVLFAGLTGRANRPMGVFLVTSQDGLGTLSPPRRVLDGDNYQARLAVDRDAGGERGRLHLVWLDARGEPALGSLPPPPNPIMAAHSDDGGRTWSDPVQVSDPERARVVAPRVAVGGEGEVHVGYYDLGDDRRDYQGLEGPPFQGEWSLVVATSTDGGERFDAQTVVTDRIAPPGRVMLIFTMPPPALATRPDGGLVAAWPDARHGDSDVLAAHRPPGGDWQAPVRVNADAADSGAEQVLPTLSVAPGGRVDALWLDRRRDPDDDVATDVYYAASRDGGASFTEHGAVNARAFDARTGARYIVPSAAGQVEWGASLGLLARDDRTLAAWPDTRHTPVAGMTQQDLFATVVTHPAGVPAWPLALAAGVLAAALATAAVALRRRRAAASAAAAGHPEPAAADGPPGAPVATPWP